MYRDEFVGVKTLKRLPELLPDDAERGLVVKGRNSYTASGAERTIENDLKIDLEYYTAPSPNPGLAELDSGFDTVSKYDPDFVVGIGGGSVLDSAKALAVLPFQSNAPRDYVSGSDAPESFGLPLYAVPTTAGTGSETTHFATIYVNNKKHSLVGSAVYPTGAIVDPELLTSAPEQVRATTGADALAQAIESYWSTRSTPASRTLALRAVELAWEHYEQEVLNSTQSTRAGMAKSAHLAGKAIDISKTTACHSVSYPITANFGVDHGLAVMLTVPPFLRFNAGTTSEDCTDPRGAAFVRNRIRELSKIVGADDANNAARRVTEMLSALGLPTTLEAAGVTDIGTVIDEGFTPERMGNNPREVTKEDLRELLESISA